MQPAPAKCAEREILEARFHADVRVYCDAIIRLDSCGPGEFDQTYEDAVRTREAFEHARAELNRHIAEHGCL